MDSAPTAETETRLLAAFWHVVALQGWHGVTMARVAAEAGLTLQALRGLARSPADLLRLHLRLLDQQVLAGTVPHQGGSARDRLFDVLMRRFDAMQPYRAGICRLAEDATRDPLLALFLAPRLLPAMAWMLEAAEVEATLPALAWRAPGLAGVWLASFRVWRQDEGADLGATMAALDRALDRAEQIGRSLRLPLDAAPDAGTG